LFRNILICSGTLLSVPEH